jgi:hypothetical protein
MKGNTGADVDRAIIQSLNCITDETGGGVPCVNQEADDEQGRSFDMRAYRRGLVFGGKEEAPENPFQKFNADQGGVARRVPARPKGKGGVDERNDEEYQRLLALELSISPVCLRHLPGCGACVFCARLNWKFLFAGYWPLLR